MELLTGFLLGLLGSFHCIGMCGPLVLALPASANFVLSRTIYNLGRVVAYGFFGLVLGFIGSRLNLSGLQQIVSITLGALIILTVLVPAQFKSRFLAPIGFEKILLVLKKNISAFYRSNNLSANLGIGILNGFLPCGFVYVALSGALIVGNAAVSSLFMIMFGIGTIPAMFAVSFAGKIISVSFRNRVKRFVTAISLIIALLFILRGLNLGIPYISPKLENLVPADENMNCH